MTDEEAWWSLRDRAAKCIEEVYVAGETEYCWRWFGPATLHIAGDRGVISPTNFVLADIGKDLCWYTVMSRTCTTRNCLQSDHWVIGQYSNRNDGASWHLHPTPGLSPLEEARAKIAAAKAKAHGEGRELA